MLSWFCSCCWRSLFTCSSKASNQQASTKRPSGSEPCPRMPKNLIAWGIYVHRAGCQHSEGHGCWQRHLRRSDLVTEVMKSRVLAGSWSWSRALSLICCWVTEPGLWRICCSIWYVDASFFSCSCSCCWRSLFTCAASKAEARTLRGSQHVNSSLVSCLWSCCWMSTQNPWAPGVTRWGLHTERQTVDGGLARRLQLHVWG